MSIAVLAAGCGGGEAAPESAEQDAIRVGGFDFAESQLLAELYAQVLEERGLAVDRLGPVGPREIVGPALELELVDLVPEYLGSLATFFAVPTDPGTPLEQLVEDARLPLAERGLVILAPARAQDTNVFIVTAEWASTNNVRVVSDLAPLADGLRFGGPPECPDRPLCLSGLRQTYGIEFGRIVPQPSLEVTAEALRRGEIDVGLMFSTAPELGSGDFVVLSDDRSLQPLDNIVPLATTAARQRFDPDLTAALDALSSVLTTLELRQLNTRVANGEPISSVASEWLLSEGLITTRRASPTPG